MEEEEEEGGGAKCQFLAPSTLPTTVTAERGDLREKLMRTGG